MVCRILDVTLREAGIANGFSFSLTQVSEIVMSLDRAGIDIIEIGYICPHKHTPTGDCCNDDYLEAVFQRRINADIAVMVHIQNVPLNIYPKLVKKGVSLIRFAISAESLISSETMAQLEAHTQAARDAGLQFTINLIRVTEVQAEVFVAVAQLAQKLNAHCLYIADSNGSLYPSQLKKIAHLLKSNTAIALGFHGHNNLQLAFANTLVALENGFTWIDGSLGGSGKGGGNLSAELIAGHLIIHAGKILNVLELSSAFRNYVLPTLHESGEESPVRHALSGFSNLNISQLASLKLESQLNDVPLEELLFNLMSTDYSQKVVVSSNT